MTKREMFNAIVTVMSDVEVAKVMSEVTDITPAEFVAFAEHEMTLLDKKKGSKKPTKTQRENAELKESIFQTLVAENRPMRVGEIALVLGLSTQKVTPQLGNLMTEHRVTMKKEKKFTFYSVATETEPNEG